MGGEERDGRTTSRFALPLESGGFGPTLRPGERVHVVLAYSRDDDFGHHSARRTAVNLDL